MKPFRSLFVVVGLAAYGAAFYATSLADFRSRTADMRLSLSLQILEPA